MPKRLDLTGQKYGKLLVIQPSDERDRGGHIKWRCQCDCGKIVLVSSCHLKSGNTTSCGCNYRKWGDNCPSRNDPIYFLWRSMINRCYVSTNTSYKNYGARGIQVCDLWRNDFLAFKDWCLNNGYNSGLELDRIDNESDYTPNNCRFVDRITQQRNKRNNVFVKYKGKNITLSEMSERMGVSYKFLWNRLQRKNN